jgi:hypothetical protein
MLNVEASCGWTMEVRDDQAEEEATIEGMAKKVALVVTKGNRRADNGELLNNSLGCLKGRTSLSDDELISSQLHETKECARLMKIQHVNVIFCH